MNHTGFARIQPQNGVTRVTTNQLYVRPCRTRELAAFADLHLHIVDNGADRHVRQRHRVAWLDVNLLARNDRVTDRETLRRFLGQQLADEAQGVLRPSENQQSTAVDRSQWIEDLRQLRESLTTGAHGTPLPEILDDLRADRN